MSNTANPLNGAYINTSGFINFVPMYGFSVIPSDSPPLEIDPSPIKIYQTKIKVGNTDGFECTDCKDFYPMAELNQPDNAKDYVRFTCYSCRKGLKTIFEE